MTPQQRQEQILLLNEITKRRALESFPDFVEYVINYDGRWKQIAPFQRSFMQSVQDNPEILMLLPRGHGKTEMITEAYPIWMMCRDPNVKILIRNENTDNAEKFLTAIKDILTNNEMLTTLFGEFKSDEKWSSDQIIIKQRNQTGIKDPTIAIGGLNKSMVGGHFNVIIDDDLVSDRNTQTLDQIRKVIDFHKNTPPLRDPNYFRWITIGTRWHYFDLYNHIMENEPEVKVIRMQAVDGDLETGNVLFPELYSREELIKIRNKIGSYIFACQYQNSPVDEADATFKFSWIERMFDSWPTELPRVLNNFILVDPAISQEKRSDYTSILGLSIDINNKIYIRKIIRDKFTMDETINEIFKLAAILPPMVVGIETNAFQKVLEYHIQKEMEERDIYLPIQTYSHHISKEVRIKALQPIYERGDIACSRSIENADVLEYELTRFPKAEHDDVSDNLSTILDIGFPPDPELNEAVAEVNFNDIIIDRIFRMADGEYEDEQTIEDIFTSSDEIEYIN